MGVMVTGGFINLDFLGIPGLIEKEERHTLPAPARDFRATAGSALTSAGASLFLRRALKTFSPFGKGGLRGI